MDERDPIAGTPQGPADSRSDDGYTIPTRETPVRLCAMPEFVRMIGGGYFFVPGRAVLRYLAAG
jgi:hypothetical protein